MIDKINNVSIQILIKLIANGPVDNGSSFVQECRRIGDKPIPEPMVTQFTDGDMRYWVSMS